MPGDVVDVIVTALLVGAANMVKDTATDALKGAYKRLIAGLHNRYGKTKTDELQDIARAATSGEETSRARLVDALAGEDIMADDEVVAAARAVLAHVDRANVQSGKYDVAVHNSQGVVVGDGTTVTQNFGRTDQR